MASESIPVGLRSLLTKHYFLAQITSGQKPCMSNMTIVNGSSWTGAFYRFWHGESKKSIMTNIENIISHTIDAISAHKDKPAFLKLIINALASTRVGLESMLTTYRKYPATIGRLKVQLKNIDLQLEEHRDLIKGYRVDDDTIEALVENSDYEDKDELRKMLKGMQKTPEFIKANGPRPGRPVQINGSSDSGRPERPDKSERMRRKRRVKRSLERREGKKEGTEEEKQDE